jgi:outer membrane lipoprotein-sorting protein
MLKRIVVFAAAAVVFSLPATAQTVDEIIAKHYAARGGVDKIRALKSIRITGRMVAGQMEIPATIENKRPEQVRMEMTIQGLVGILGYDGTTGWQVMPFMGKKDPEPMSGDDLKDIQEQADFDGPLLDYKAKGNQVELLGKEKVEGADCYKLKVTLKNGIVHTLFIDSDSFLEIKDISKRTIRGTEQEVESTSGDYKEVEGIIFPFVIEQGTTGSPQKQRIIIEKIELNPAIDDARFKMPAAAPAAPAQAAAPKPADSKPPRP